MRKILDQTPKSQCASLSLSSFWGQCTAVIYSIDVLLRLYSFHRDEYRVFFHSLAAALYSRFAKRLSLYKRTTYNHARPLGEPYSATSGVPEVNPCELALSSMVGHRDRFGVSNSEFTAAVNDALFLHTGFVATP